MAPNMWSPPPEVMFPEASAGARHIGAYAGGSILIPYLPRCRPRPSANVNTRPRPMIRREPIGRLIVLSVKERAVRCRLLGSERSSPSCGPPLGPGARRDRHGRAAEAVALCRQSLSLRRDPILPAGSGSPRSGASWACRRWACGIPRSTTGAKRTSRSRIGRSRLLLAESAGPSKWNRRCRGDDPDDSVRSHHRAVPILRTPAIARRR